MTTTTTIALAGMPTLTSTPDAPIARILPLVLYTGSIISSIFSTLVSTVRGLHSLIPLSLLSYLLSPIPNVVLYILSPVTLILSFAYSVTAWTAGLGTGVLDDVRPVYAFIGAACIVGAGVGALARLIVWGAQTWILGDDEAIEEEK
jgi:hypothetical protein